MLEKGEGKGGALDGGWRVRVGRGVRRVEHWRGERVGGALDEGVES